jgi:hypothetical protein
MSAPEHGAETAPPVAAAAPAPPTISPAPTIPHAQPVQPVQAVPPIAAAPMPAPAQFGEPVVPTIASVPPVAAPVSPAPAASAPEPVAPEAAAATVAPAPGAPVSIAPQGSPEATTDSGRAAPELPEDEPDPPLAAEADVDDEPLLTLEVWQVGVLVLGFLVVVAHFVVGTPLPAYSAAAKFRLVIKLVGVLGALALLLALRKRRQGA